MWLRHAPHLHTVNLCTPSQFRHNGVFLNFEELLEILDNWMLVPNVFLAAGG
jgi:hypothetical protein